MKWYNVLGCHMYLTEESINEIKNHCKDVLEIESTYSAKEETITLANIKAIFSRAATKGTAVTISDFYEYF